MKRLLVIRFSALGDVAMLVPVLRLAAAQNPDVQMTVLSQQWMADLFAGMPDNVTFHGVDLKRQSLCEIVAGLGSYDLVADMHGVWRSLFISTVFRFRGARVRTIHKGRFQKFLLTHGIVRNPLPHTSSRYEKVLYCLGLDRCKSDAPLISAGQGIGIAPFAAHVGKIYPLERMEQVVKLLSSQKEKIILFGSRQEAEVLDAWAQKYKGVESIAGKKSLREELEIMRGLRVMLTMDSANMHLASLAGTRVVSVWGATHPNAGFLGFGQKESDCVQQDLKCRPCSVYGKRKCKYGDYRCLQIAPETIVEKLLDKE